MSTHPPREEATPPAAEAWAHAPRAGETRALRIETLDSDGSGIAHVHAAVGGEAQARRWRWVVEGALPGEQVVARVEARRGKRVFAKVEGVVAASPMRVRPRCAHLDHPPYPPCGGCTLQHVDPDQQGALKSAHLVKLFASLGVEASRWLPSQPATLPWGYRNKIELTFSTDPQGDLALGFFPRGYRNEVFPLQACEIASPRMAPFVRATQAWARDEALPPFQLRAGHGWLRNLVVRAAFGTEDLLVELIVDDVDHVDTADGSRRCADELSCAFAERMLATARESGLDQTQVFVTRHRARRGEPTQRFERAFTTPGHLDEVLRLPDGKTLTFAIQPRTFFQTNSSQAAILVATVLRHAGLWRAPTDDGGNAHPSSGAQRPHRVVDLYCGTGTLGLCAAHYAGEVIGVDIVPSAIEDAQRNATRNGLAGRTTWICADVGPFLATNEGRRSLGGADVVILDPPREGLLRVALEHLRAIAAPRLVLVSCNPTSLARDLPGLAALGYEVEAMEAVDMFPHTTHLEVVCSLVLRSTCAR